MLLRGGSLRHLAALRFRGGTFIFTSLAVQLLLYMPFLRTSAPVLRWGGFGLAAQLAVSLPGMEQAAAQALIDKAHQVCPYSNATRGNVDVRLSVV